MPGSESERPAKKSRRDWFETSSSILPRNRVLLPAPEAFARRTSRGDTHVDISALDFRFLRNGPLNQQVPANPRRRAPVPEIQSDPQISGNRPAHPPTSQSPAHQSLHQGRSKPFDSTNTFAQSQKYQPIRRLAKKRQRSPSPDQAEGIVAGVAQAQSTEAASDLSQQHSEDSPPPNLQNPPLTCYLWLSQYLGWKASGCKSTAEECPWSHTFTGYVVDKFSDSTTVIQASTPYQLHMKQFNCKYHRRHGVIGPDSRRGCRKPDCQFSHVVEGPGSLGGTRGWEDTKWADEEDMDKKVRLFIESREEEFDRFLSSLTRTG